MFHALFPFFTACRKHLDACSHVRCTQLHCWWSRRLAKAFASCGITAVLLIPWGFERCKAVFYLSTLVPVSETISVPLFSACFQVKVLHSCNSEPKCVRHNDMQILQPPST
eukprot:3163776-Amphidinium_carterae.1